MDHTFEKRKKVMLDFISDDLYVPMKIKEIAAVLQIPREQREELKAVLDALVDEGKITLSKRGKYSKGEQVRLKGIFCANVRGFGFVCPEDESEDVYISEDNLCGAFQGDEVEFIVTGSPAGRRREGRIVRILAHNVVRIVGLYEQSKGFGFVRPDDQRYINDIYIPAGKENGAMTGHKVVVELSSYGGTHMKPEGRVAEIIGHVNDPGTDILSIVMDMGIPSEFPEKVLNQAIRVGKEVSAADCAGRKDLRDWMMVTIDGEDAKDLDDAVSVRKNSDGTYELGVHIADVTNYVQERSALDVEALKRGTSVYLVDRVIPMLPHTLSNGICSLNAGEDRLALSCLMTVDEKGNIVDHRIAETVIRVDRRMSYTDVNKIITLKDPETTERYRDFAGQFFLMKELADLLRARRRKRGSIDFDFPETKVILDGEGHPLDIRPYDRNPATKIIEDFMLAANETVAQDFFWQEIPFLYRTHETPDTEKIRKLGTFINNFGYHIHLAGEEVHPKELQKLLEKIDDTPVEPLISRLTLRSMKQARYSVECVGHFGLAAKYYCHFTSPIRRYPDLQIHRIIKETLRGRMDGGRREHYEKILPAVARETSELERRAEEAERETIKMKKVEYMEQRIGRIYEGVISGITKYGIYVELPNTVEGMVHVADIPGDYYEYLEDTYEMAGEHTGKRYKLGQTVRIRVTGADRLLRQIQFALLKDEEEEWEKTVSN